MSYILGRIGLLGGLSSAHNKRDSMLNTLANMSLHGCIQTFSNEHRGVFSDLLSLYHIPQFEVYMHSDVSIPPIMNM